MTPPKKKQFYKSLTFSRPRHTNSKYFPGSTVQTKVSFLWPAHKNMSASVPEHWHSRFLTPVLLYLCQRTYSMVKTKVTLYTANNSLPGSHQFSSSRNQRGAEITWAFGGHTSAAAPQLPSKKPTAKLRADFTQRWGSLHRLPFPTLRFLTFLNMGNRS